jgi:hypothetical protein
MGKLIFGLVLGLVLALAGCATGPRFQNYAGANASCVEGDTANLVRFYTEGEAHVFIQEIDDLPTGGGMRFCVSAGKHRLGISAYNIYRQAAEYFDFDLEAGRNYRVRANLQGISFVFHFVDITDGKETRLSELRVKVTSETQPATVPMIIPKGK